MIPVTDDISIAESELTFHFIRSTGPGGQNVNKVSTAAQLRFDAAASPSLPEDVRRRLRGIAGKRMTAAGEIIITAQRFRSQERNREDAIDRLVRMVQRAAEPPRPRTATRPTRAMVARRLADKARRGVTKKSRSPVHRDED
ncbi:MAG: alternative ribosome rescue aminoacyl-tRNA hydrolase ArfB [Chloroflexi bacterium]|nr:alternative ribosome rescue aminoacyl-tRNA hydrolase ArfB [Chloroflexota bacterium]